MPYTRPTKFAMSAIPPLLQPQTGIAQLLPPAHIVNLITDEGAAAFGAIWKGLEAKTLPCPALADSRPEFKTTYDIELHAEIPGFDDSTWENVSPTDLGGRSGGGMVSFFWFRTTLTIPTHATGFAAAGAKTVLHITADDYAEIWVNGELPCVSGRPSPTAIQGFNTPNRLVFADTVTPGNKYEIAVFAINGSISTALPTFSGFAKPKMEFFQ